MIVPPAAPGEEMETSMHRTKRWIRGVFFALPLPVLVACGGSDIVRPGPAPKVYGSGTIVEETRSVIGATGVNLLGAADVDIEQGAPEQIVLRADDNLMSRIYTYVRNGVLEIAEDPNVDLEPSQTIQAEVRLSSLSSIILSGAGDIDVAALTTTNLDLTLTGAGEIDVRNLDAQTLGVLHSGVGEIRTAGDVVDQQITVTGVGDYEGELLSSQTADVLITGVGSATLRVSTTLDVTITGSGSVYYYGDPALTTNISGTGTCTRLGP